MKTYMKQFNPVSDYGWTISEGGDPDAIIAHVETEGMADAILAHVLGTIPDQSLQFESGVWYAPESWFLKADHLSPKETPCNLKS